MESHGMALKIRLIIALSFMNFDIEYLISMLYYMSELWLFRVQNAGHGLRVPGCGLRVEREPQPAASRPRRARGLSFSNGSRPEYRITSFARQRQTIPEILVLRPAEAAIIFRLCFICVCLRFKYLISYRLQVD
jgi:hypothetical protein